MGPIAPLKIPPRRGNQVLTRTLRTSARRSRKNIAEWFGAGNEVPPPPSVPARGNTAPRTPYQGTSTRPNKHPAKHSMANQAIHLLSIVIAMQCLSDQKERQSQGEKNHKNPQNLKSLLRRRSKLFRNPTEATAETYRSARSARHSAALGN